MSTADNTSRNPSETGPVPAGGSIRNELSLLRRAEARLEASEKELFEVNEQLDQSTQLCQSQGEEIERLKVIIAEGSYPTPSSEQQEMTSHIAKLEQELKQKTSHFVVMIEGNADFYKSWGDSLLTQNNQNLERQNAEYHSGIQKLTSKISNLQVQESIHKALIESKSRTINEFFTQKMQHQAVTTNGLVLKRSLITIRFKRSRRL